MINVLFVCMGNTCRSVMCEYIFKNMLKEKNLLNKISVNSCGICAFNNNPAAENAIKVISAFDPKIINHQAKILTIDFLRTSDYVFALDHTILNYIIQNFEVNDICKINCINSKGIPDPYGLSLSVYQASAEEIKKSLKIILDKMIKDENL